MSDFTWDSMDYWDSGEFQVVQERLDDMDKAKQIYCPKREDLFAALDATPFEKVRVAIIGQDPYPDPRYATGIAFSIPKDIVDYPPTLVNIFKEYEADLGLPFPTTGCLIPWCNQGILLWNSIPSCQAFASLSHEWEEWKPLTREIVERLSSASVLMVFLGGRAREYLQYVDLLNSDVILTSHPSPRGNQFSKTPFTGSHLFTTINDKLQGEGLTPISWRLS